VSRGAAQHHFPTREALFLASVEHMAKARRDEMRREVAARSSSPTTHDIVDMVVENYVGTVFRAALELWVASSSEPVLREQVVKLERVLGREMHASVVAALGVDESVPGIRETIQATLDLARGLGLANLLTDDSRRRKHIVDQWAKILDLALAAAIEETA
jgi:AcrR family transcriptional regulator